MLCAMHPDGASGPEDATPAAGSGSVFSTRSTIVYAALWAALTLYGWQGFIVDGHAAELAYPLEAAERVVDHDLYLATALAGRPAAERRVWAFFEGSPEALRQDALDVQREAIDLGVDWSEPEALDRARARLAVLLAEDGQLDAALDQALEVSEPFDLHTALERAYGPARTGTPPALLEFDVPRIGGWAGTMLDLRLARRYGAVGLATSLERGLGQRAAAALRGSRWVVGAQCALVGTGLVLLALGVAARRLPAAPPSRRGPPPWSLGTGLGVLVRGDFWSRLYFVLLLALPPAWSANTLVDLLYRTGTLVGSLPLLLLAWRHLVAPSLERDPLGLRARAPGPAALVAFTLVVAAIDFVATDAVGWATWALGSGWSWAESFDETLALGAAVPAGLAVLDLVVWTPLVEELAFRGVLFFSLRRRLGPFAAAATSAAVFASLHFYSWAGLAVTFASGFVWALAFERVRSLWPGVGAHALYNALYVAGVVLAYR